MPYQILPRVRTNLFKVFQFDYNPSSPCQLILESASPTHKRVGEPDKIGTDGQWKSLKTTAYNIVKIYKHLSLAPEYISVIIYIGLCIVISV